MTAVVVPNTEHPAIGNKPTTPCRIYRGPHQGKGGYGAPTWNGEQVQLHRWVVEQVEGPLLPGEVVLHRCDTPACFRYDHLLRGTQALNLLDAKLKGRHRYEAHFGEANGGGRKLAAEQVRAIRQRYVRGRSHHPGNQEALAEEFGVSVSLIKKIVTGKLWASV